MAGTESGAPFQRIEELEQENEVLRERLKQAEEDMERLQRENEQLRKELKAAGRGSRHGRRKPKADPKRPGRKAGQGPFTFRKAPPDTAASSEPPIAVPVTVGQCPCCGGELRYERTDEATVTDMPQAAQPEVKRYAVEVRRCQRCGQPVRGQHPEVARISTGRRRIGSVPASRQRRTRCITGWACQCASCRPFCASSLGSK